jgi:hypothetical protein
MGGTLQDEGLEAPHLPTAYLRGLRPLPVGSAPPPERHARRPGELRCRSTRRPLGLTGTSPRSHRSSRSCALPRASLLLTGLTAAAGTAAACRRETSPAWLPPTPSHQIGSGRASGRPPTFPRPRAAADLPESGHPRRRPTPGTQLRIPESSQGLPMQSEDLPVRKPKLLRSPVQKETSIVFTNC